MLITMAQNFKNTKAKALDSNRSYAYALNSKRGSWSPKRKRRAY
jgi:hypothetical protein